MPYSYQDNFFNRSEGCWVVHRRDIDVNFRSLQYVLLPIVINTTFDVIRVKLTFMFHIVGRAELLLQPFVS